MKFLHFIIPLTISLSVQADKNTISAKDFALKQCMINNYNKFNNSNLDDATDLSENYTPSERLKIHDYVTDKTKDFYNETLIYHLEGKDKKMNMIFSKCMQFYHSKELMFFLKKNKFNK